MGFTASQVGESVHLTTGVLLVAVAWLVYRLVARYNRLRHIPGPLLPAFTDLYYQWRLWRNDDMVGIVGRLHEKYGPVVRWGPNRVSFASTTAIPLIYGTKDVFPKAPSYQPMVVSVQGQETFTLVTIQDETRMSQVKSKISAGFSQATWLKQEHQMDETLETLVQRLHEVCQSRDPIVLYDWLCLWTFDTLTELAFSDSRNFLAHGRDVDGVFAGAKARFTHWKNWELVPTLERLFFKSSLAQWLHARVGKPPGSALAKFAMERIQDRKRQLGVVEGEKADERMLADAGKDLVGRFLAASVQSPHIINGRDVLALTISTIQAGADTTASATAHVLADALSQPETWKMLEEELLGAGLTCPPAFKAVASLPVLDAVVRESMRYSYLSGTLPERRAPHDSIISDVKIPKGTDVAVSVHGACRDTAVYGPDVDVFRPQRWLEADEQQWQAMEKATFVFLHGKRNCIGRHLAWIEMKKVVATLILSFKMTLAEPPVSSFKGHIVRTVDLKVHMEPRA